MQKPSEEVTAIRIDSNLDTSSFDSSSRNLVTNLDLIQRGKHKYPNTCWFRTSEQIFMDILLGTIYQPPKIASPTPVQNKTSRLTSLIWLSNEIYAPKPIKTISRESAIVWIP